MKFWKVCAAFVRPKDVKGKSKRPKGMVIADCWCQLVWARIWWYTVTKETLLTVPIPCIFLELQKEKTSYVSVLLVIS